jgi:hypothetical protein
MISANIISISSRRNSPSGTQEQYDEALEAVIARATLEEYDMPDEQCLRSVSNFLKKRRSDGSLAKMDFLFLTAIKNGGADLDLFSAIDYINPTRQFDPINSPSFTSLGWAGDGLSSYIELPYNPTVDAVNYLQNDASIGSYNTEAATIGTGMFGYTSSSSGVRMISASHTQQRINSGTNNLPAAHDMSGEGYRAMDRNSGSNCSFYVGTTKTDYLVNSAVILDVKFCIGRSNTAFANQRWGIVFAGGSLTEQHHNNIKTDFETYLIESGIVTP